MPWPIQSIQSTIISNDWYGGTFDPNQPERQTKLEGPQSRKTLEAHKPRKSRVSRTLLPFDAASNLMNKRKLRRVLKAALAKSLAEAQL